MLTRLKTSEDDLNNILNTKFTNEFRTGYITVDGVCLPEYYTKFAGAIENMEVRDDDVWVCSFPKTGTTWTQEMVWCIANDLDFDGAQEILSKRFSFLDFTLLFDYRTIISRNPDFNVPELNSDSISYINKCPSPRFIKTHLPFHLLPKQLRNSEKSAKIIYVTRNAKDTCVSYYHHCKLLEGYCGDFIEFCSLFLGGKLCFAPFWKHVLGYWNKSDQKNFLFIKYEDMKTDLASIIKKTADFLGKNLKTDDIKILENHLSFTSMKKNPAVNYENVIELNKKLKLIEIDGQFMRKGKVNQGKGEMSDEVIEEFNKWTAENLKHTNLNL